MEINSLIHGIIKIFCISKSVFIIHIRVFLRRKLETAPNNIKSKIYWFGTKKKTSLDIIYNLFNLWRKHDKAFCFTSKKITWVFSYIFLGIFRTIIHLVWKNWRKINQRGFKVHFIMCLSQFYDVYQTIDVFQLIRNWISCHQDVCVFFCFSLFFRNRIHAKNILYNRFLAYLFRCELRLTK